MKAKRGENFVHVRQQGQRRQTRDGCELVAMQTPVKMIVRRKRMKQTHRYTPAHAYGH